MTFAITVHGECPTCGVSVTVHGSGIVDLPVAAVGTDASEPLACLEGHRFPGVIVGVLLDPWHAERDDDEEVIVEADYDDDELDEAVR